VPGIFSWFNFGRSNVSRNLSISSTFSSLLEYKFVKHYLMILCVSLIFVVIAPFFTFNFINMNLFSFFVSLAKGFSTLFIFPKN
jgi:hypothetical protein